MTTIRALGARPVLLVGAACVGLVTGCYGDIDAFAQRSAKLSCKRQRECQKSAFEDAYNGDLDRCRDRVETTILDAADEAMGVGCDYVAEEGRKCISEAYANRAVCGADADQDIADACEEVFDCPGVPVEQPFPSE